MDRLVRQRQRDARRSGRAVTSISSLPAELLGSIVKYACPYVSRGYGGYEGPYLATFLRVGCTNRGFLEAVQQVEQMRVDVMDRPRRERVEPRLPGVNMGVKASLNTVRRRASSKRRFERRHTRLPMEH